MATTYDTMPSNLKAMDQEVHIINWDGAGATDEVTTGLSVIYAASVCDAFGSATGHTADDMGIVELDETIAADGSITVVGGVVTINRIPANDTDGTLATGQSCVILWGKS
jgi:hypothetical protein